MKRNKKKKKFRAHTKNRLQERYDVNFNHEDLKILKGLIRAGKSEIVKAYSNARKVHKVNYKGMDILVLYNKNLQEIATVFEYKNNIIENRFNKLLKKD
jgi:hypothetical protein